MLRSLSSSHILGLVCILATVLALAVWIPLDIETGLIEKVRRQTSIGDSLLPTLACGFVLLGGLFLFLPGKDSGEALTGVNLRYLILLLVILAVAFAAMRWLGPVLVWAFTEEGVYRNLRDTAPWKYVGYITGGTILVSGLLAMVEGKVTVRGIVIGLIATLALILVYDLPFDDLLLPPNGDV
ncbi:MAG: hypothetical protein AAGA21_25360 [Pseudomonadota bacterium]